LLVRCICAGAQDDTLLFTPEDADGLGRQQWQGLDRACDAAQRLNRLSDKAIEEDAEAVIPPTP